ncbi:hypothetical protein D3C71_2168190 [compost metagenome]
MEDVRYTVGSLQFRRINVSDHVAEGGADLDHLAIGQGGDGESDPLDIRHFTIDHHVLRSPVRAWLRARRPSSGPP